MKKTTLASFVVVISIAHLALAANESTGSGCAIAGPSDAKLTIEEFIDFECPFCVKGSETVGQILKDYDGKIRLVLHNMPLQAHGPVSTLAAKAFIATCMQSPSMAFQFQKELFEHQGQLKDEGEPFIYETAEKVGANLEKLKLDMGGATVAKALENDLQQAKDHNFNGTPSFLVGTESIPGAQPYEKFKEAVDRQLGH